MTRTIGADEPTVKLVTDSFFECVNDLARNIEIVLEKHSNAREPEKAFHVNRLIRKWFDAAGRL